MKQLVVIFFALTITASCLSQTVNDANKSRFTISIIMQPNKYLVLWLKKSLLIQPHGHWLGRVWLKQKIQIVLWL